MSVEDTYRALQDAYTPDKVGYRIRILRQTEELTQSALARKLNLTPSAISQIEGGISRPANEVELRFKAAFRVTIDWIRFGDEGGLTLDMVQRLERARSIVGPPDVPDLRSARKPRQFTKPARKVPAKKK